MKVIFVTREGYQLPGARIRCYNFSKALSSLGVNTQVISFADTLGAKDGANESRLNILDKINFNRKAYSRLLKEGNDSIIYLQRFNYHSFAPYFAHLINKFKIILDLDDWEMRENPRYYLGLFPSSKAHYFTKKIAKASVCCVAASNFLKDFLIPLNKNTYYIPTGVDTQLFKSNNLNEEKNNVVFSWIGTFHKREYVENIAFVIKCFLKLRSNYRNIYLEITGEGIHETEIKELVGLSKDSHVVLNSWIDPDKIPGYLQRIDIGLFPVTKDNKFNNAKSPTKLFEYMAMSKPTISSCIGEAAYVITHEENGFLAQSEEEYVNMMDRLILDPQLRFKMGKQARETIENKYSLEILGKQLFDIIQKI